MGSQLRMTGLISGLDTESIISQLVSAKQVKVDAEKGNQTKLSWKQEIWKDLNTDLKSLQSTIANMRYTTNYAKKTTTVSDPNKVSVITGSEASDSVQSLTITQLAKTAYTTGARVTEEGAEKATALSTLGDLGFSGSGTIRVKGSENGITVDSSTTISEVLTALKNEGLNANFDEGQQRLFVSSKTSGEDGNFELIGDDTDGWAALSELGLLSYDSEYYTSAQSYDEDDIKATAASRVQAYLATYKEDADKVSEDSETIADLLEKTGLSETDLEDLDTIIAQADQDVTDKQTQIDALDTSAEDYETTKKEYEDELAELKERQTNLNTLKTTSEEKTSLQAAMDELEENFADLEETEDGYTASASDKLIAQVTADYAARKEAASGISEEDGAIINQGQNASIVLNGAKFTSNTNVFAVNGLTITATGTTGENEEITLTTQQDTSGIYDMIKSFFTAYNKIVNKMDTLYNADSASGYSPLTDDEKDTMSDSEVEKYEQKIKDSLLKNDSTINSISSTLQEVMSAGIKVGDKTYYLSNFGIDTLSYFSSSDNEKHAYHIDGDSEDSSTSGNTDKLKSMIASDSDTVVGFFTKLCQNLYGKMSDLSTSVDGYRTYGTFYNDKKMSSDYSAYSSKISNLEEKLNDYEDKLYSQYSAMETALAKLQSNSSSVTSLLSS